MTIGRLQILSVPVADQDRAKEFYVEKLGFEVVTERPMGPEATWLQVAPAGAETSITLVTWFEEMQPGAVQGLVLETDDIESDVAALQERGVEFDADIQEFPWGRSVTFNDPDGNGLILQTPASAGA